MRIHGLRLAQKAFLANRWNPLPSTLLTQWQDIVVARHAQRRALTRDDRDWIKNEVRWAFEHFQESDTLHAGPEEHSRQQSLFIEACERLSKGEPLAYVLGSQPFGDLPFDLSVRAPVLIPRPETEQWALNLADQLRDFVAGRPTEALDIRVLDICTGSGCIAILLSHCLRQLRSKHQHLRWKVLGLDVSPIAVDLARTNATRLGPLSDDASLDFYQADVFSDTDMTAVFQSTFGPDVFETCQDPCSPKPINIIVSNPPYIRPDAYRDQLESSVRDWEDFRALVGVHPSTAEVVNSALKQDDEAGLTFYRRIRSLVGALPWMHQRRLALPKVVLEIGQGQAEAVTSIFSDLSGTTTTQIQVHKDAWGVERTVEIY
ncbi:hypothetical protein OC846_000470 [Tilletia horrida]|uniref:Methyltransferase domain-containing protein n=1 Tax=Tilletia horrida TaxID=155126 RepID=A0AAN6GXV3_9BASI|nr:hypothetical protein OC846_000470 [Tilletia horrida]KAK0567902.1 hypothetical protein OC861_002462 [Tilletia horrida]